MRRTTLVIALAVTAGTFVPAASAASEPTVRVTSATDGFRFTDMSRTASYAVTCGSGRCPAARAATDVDTRRREVRLARLGFDATRTSEAVGQPGVTGETLQEESVTVRVVEAGDLDVTLAGTKTGTVDAAPVAGSASSGGTVAGRTVRWHRAKAKAGTYTFTARFRVVVDPTAVGSYTTRATVERSVRTTALLENAWGSQPAGRTVRRVSALTFAERVAPAYGAPHGQPHPWTYTRDTDGHPDFFAGSVSASAYGAYNATASGVAGATSAIDLRTVAPGASGMAAGMSYSGYGSTEEKFTPQGDFVFDEDSFRLTGFSIAACAESVLGSDWTGATLYDRDTATYSAFADVFSVNAKRTGPPRNDAGRLRASWSGRLLSGVTETSYGSVLGSEEPIEEMEYGANVAWVVTGGDLDNRSGDKRVTGTAATMRVPRHERITYLFAGSTVLEDTEFDLDMDVARDGRTATIKGMVGPGGYWLRSTRKGYVRDWATNTSLVVGAAPAGASAGASGGTPEVAPVTALRLVPPGTRALIQYAVPGAPVRRLLLDPGTWSVTTAGGVLRAARVVAGDTSGCASVR